MDQKKQQDVRRHAAESFFKSFEQQLLDVFQDESSEAGKTQPKPQDSSLQPTLKDPAESISLSELEDAIADIDHYFENQQSENPKLQE